MMESRNCAPYSGSDPEPIAILKTVPARAGGIRHIARDGLVFEYVLETPAPPGVGSLDISSVKESERIRDLPCEVLEDRKISNGRSGLVPIPTRHCRVKFGNLTVEQHRKIDALVETFHEAGDGSTTACGERCGSMRDHGEQAV